MGVDKISERPTEGRKSADSDILKNVKPTDLIKRDSLAEMDEEARQ